MRSDHIGQLTFILPEDHITLIICRLCFRLDKTFIRTLWPLDIIDRTSSSAAGPDSRFLQSHQPDHASLRIQKDVQPKQKKTRNLGQSPTWVRPAMQVWLGKNSWGWNSPSGKVTWPEIKCISV